MRKVRRQVFYLVAGVTTVMGIVASCGFPEPQLVDVGSEGGEDSARDSTVEPDAATDGTTGDATSESSPPVIDATSEKPPIDAADGCCDCDDDGYLAKDAGAQCIDSGKPSGDCDDLDKRAYPDAGFVTDQPTTDTLGDWNCDGKVNGELTPVINCAARTGGLINNNCDGEKGFVDNPACGAQSSFVECETTGVSGCTQGGSELKRQGCK